MWFDVLSEQRKALGKALIDPCWDGDADTVAELIKKGADVDFVEVRDTSKQCPIKP